MLTAKAPTKQLIKATPAEQKDRSAQAPQQALANSVWASLAWSIQPKLTAGLPDAPLQRGGRTKWRNG